MKTLKIHLCCLLLAYLLVACSAPEGDFTGSEYMPDMAHSIAYETNTVQEDGGYYYNTWKDESVASKYDLARLNRPVEGTIPRGYAGIALRAQTQSGATDQLDAELDRNYAALNFSAPMNGHAPYYYENSPEGRLDAIENLIVNPFPITEKGLEIGEELYNTFCGICHGENGNGLGYIYDTEANPNAKYPAAPASFLRDEYLEASNGRYYHAIMYGYNVMGAYADKMNYEERWNVIHYIRKLQAKEKGLEYSPESNTLDPEKGTPASLFDPTALRDLSNFGNQLGQAAGSAETENSEAEEGGTLKRKK
ncbi:MAG: cytochrome c [Bacteroidota bacterium]